MKEKSDDQLIRECLNGNSNAFNVLIDRYQYLVYGMCYHFTQNFTDAKDLTQETFISAFLNLHQLRNLDKFSAWLRQVSVNVCRMWRRRQDRYRKVSIEEVREEDLADKNSPSPQEIVETKELQSIVRKALSCLPLKNRLTLTLYHIDGLTYREISGFLNIPKTTIKSRLYKARKKLRKEVLKMVNQEFQQIPLPDDFANQVLQEVRVTRIEGINSIEDLRAMKQANKQVYPALILTSKEKPNRHLFIWIGVSEGISIFATQQGRIPPRPLTHDLMVSLLKATNASVQKVIVTDLRGKTFIGKIILQCNGQIKEIDCRPSDAVAIAVRVKAPIFVAKKMEEKNVWIEAKPENLKKSIEKVRDEITATHKHK